MLVARLIRSWDQLSRLGIDPGLRKSRDRLTRLAAIFVLGTLLLCPQSFYADFAKFFSWLPRLHDRPNLSSMLLANSSLPNGRPP